jgi:hypothetical protein
MWLTRPAFWYLPNPRFARCLGGFGPKFLAAVFLMSGTENQKADNSALRPGRARRTLVGTLSDCSHVVHS